MKKIKPRRSIVGNLKIYALIAIMAIILIVGTAWYYFAKLSDRDGLNTNPRHRQSGQQNIFDSESSGAASAKTIPIYSVGDSSSFILGGDENAIQQAIESAQESGQMISDLEIIEHSGELYYSAVFRPSDTVTDSKWAMTTKQFEDECASRNQSGFQLVDIELYERKKKSGTDVRWAGIWSKSDSRSNQYKIEISVDELKSLLEDESVRLMDVEARSNGDRLLFSILYDQPAVENGRGDFVATFAKYDLNNVDFNKDYLWHRARQQFLMQVQAYQVTYKGLPDVRFAVIYQQPRTDLIALTQWVLIDAIAFDETNQQLAKDGYELVDVHCNDYDGNLVFGGIWYQFAR